MSFGYAVELAVAMPLSWIPLISDYTKNAAKPKAATLLSVVAYFIGSCWMYTIGLGAALYSGQSDISVIMVSVGLGTVGIIILLLSTVTTTYLDVYSAGISFLSISKEFSDKIISTTVLILGTLIAIFTPIEQYQNFLYFIGSVFAPMIAIMIADYFIIKKDHSAKAFNITNIILWIIGFVIIACLCL
jgi:putative hydroxymethylpyrimidine transporter CytX